MKAHLREALESEAKVLSDIAIRSKAHWGYPQEWLDAWRPGLSLSPGYIRQNRVWVILREDDPVGFYALKTEGDHYLDHLWLLPEAIGHGIGRQAFEHAALFAGESGMTSFLIISDFHAEGFYLKMGAGKIGEFFSPQQNRMLPKLIFQVRAGPSAKPGPRFVGLP